MRELFNYPPLLLVLNFIVGIVVESKFRLHFFELKIAWLIYGLAIICFLVFRSYKPISKYLEFGVFSMFFIFFGIASLNITSVRNANNYFEKHLSTQQNQISTLVISEVLKGNNSFDRYVAKVTSVNEKRTKGNIVLNIRRDALKGLDLGRRILVDSEFQPVQKPKNPSEFNYANYLANQQIYHQMYLVKDEFQVLKRSSETFIMRLQNFRASLIQKLEHAGIENDELAVISALLLGDRTSLSTELRQSYINAGAIHILAISGLHVGILLMLFSFLMQPLKSFKHGKLISQFVVLIGLWLFAVIAGLSPSVVRAVTMFSFISVGLFLNRKNSVYHSLIASAFVLLLVHPRFLFEVGFQLSYTAVFAIVWLQPKLENIWKPRYKLLQYFWKLFTVSGAAQLGVLPLSLFYFHQFPSLFFLSNIVIIPVLGVLLGTGLFVLLLVELNVDIEFLIDSYSKLIGLLNDFISFVAGFESAVIQNIYWSVGMLLTAYAVLLFFFKYTERKTSFRMSIAVFSIAAFYGVLFVEVYFQKHQKELLVFHRNRTTLIGRLEGRALELHGASEKEHASLVNSFMASRGINEVKYTTELPSVFFAGDQPVVVIDSLGLFSYTSVENPAVLLVNSPKINLERMIEVLRPASIIADGSNYKSYVKRWEKSALKTKTPFHDTSQRGAYIFRCN